MVCAHVRRNVRIGVDNMKPLTSLILATFILGVSCKDTTTGPSLATNLLINSTFEWNGVSSLHGWTVSDTTGMEFSTTDIPLGGSGSSIELHPMGIPPLPEGTIYQTIPAPIGTHRYDISVFGKMRVEIGGGVHVSLNRPFSNQWKGYFRGIQVIDTTWTFYSTVDTITAIAGDTIFVILSGGVCEACHVQASTHLNTCRFVKLD